MPRVTSQEYREWVKQWDSDDPLVLLVEIVHESLTDSVRISSDMTQFLGFEPETQEPLYGTVSNGKTYYAFPFAFTLPDQPEGSDTTTKAQFRLDNVSQTYTQVIRDLLTAPKLRLAFVFASAPNTYVYQLPELNITDITYDATTITCDLAAADFRLEAFPGVQFYPSVFPGLFS